MLEKFEKLPLRNGVGMVVLNKDNYVFVGKRIDNPKNFWQMPQGGVDKNENFFSAALRELKEETSIKSIEVLEEIEKNKRRRKDDKSASGDVLPPNYSRS